MWDTSDVDYILVLDLDSVKHMPSGQQVLREVSLYSILFIVNAIIFHLLRLYYIQHMNSNEDDVSTNTTILMLSKYVKFIPVILVIGGLFVLGRALSRKTSYGVFSRKVIQTVSFSIIS